MAVEQPREHAATASRPVPSATPVASGAGATPATAPSGGSDAAADGVSSPGAKLVVPEGPYLGRQDLAAEDKVWLFDRIADQVWFVLLFFRVILERHSAFDGSSPRGCERSLVIGHSRRF